MTKTSVIPSGKYRGNTVEEILEIDPEYFLQRHRLMYFEDSILEEAIERINMKEMYENLGDYEEY